MKIPLFIAAIIVAACGTTSNQEDVSNEIVETEKAFEKMAAEKSIAEAFYFFAADSAVIKRGDELIKGKDAIMAYYQRQANQEATVNWAPDFVDVSASGDLAYTYGKYLWRIKTDTAINEYRGVFHTVWKRQPDNSWKYVWD